MTRTQTQAARRAYTLVEMMVAIAMFALVALALQSAVVLASRALPDRKSANSSQLAATRAAERINSELTYALTVTELTAKAITFTVADRDNDGVDETIRYAWSGTAGQPVTRTYKGGTAYSVLDDAREFALAFDKRAVLQPTTYTESAETLLYNQTGGLLNVDFVIKSDDWCGQYFVPTLPNGIEYWTITRARYLAADHSSDVGVSRVQVRTANASGLPTGVVLDQATLQESSLSSSYTWRDAYFTNATGLDPNSGACIVVRWVYDAEACDILMKTVSLALVGGHKSVSTSNAGSTWTANALRLMPLQVYGRTATKDPDSYKYYLQAVRMTMRSGADTSARVNASARILSTPEVAGP